jgi:hypothetical protein
MASNEIGAKSLLWTPLARWKALSENYATHVVRAKSVEYDLKPMDFLQSKFYYREEVYEPMEWIPALS